MSEPRYESSKGYRKELIDYLIDQYGSSVAVTSWENSEVEAYFKKGTYIDRIQLLNIDGQESPYRISRATASSGNFPMKVVFTADWGDVFDA